MNLRRSFRVMGGIVSLTLIISACVGGGVRRIYTTGGMSNAHEVAEVMRLASREEIVATPKMYDLLRRAGISDQDIQNGSLGMGRIFCCGGTGTVETEDAAFFYIPPGLHAEKTDIVEYVVGAGPDEDNPARVNTVVKIRHKNGIKSGACRFVPEDPRLWMRVIYCDWMRFEGWEKRGGLHPVWHKPQS